MALAIPLSLDLVQDGSFEDGPNTTSWIQNPAANWDLVVDFAAHWGDFGLHLSRGLDAIDSIYQDVLIPSEATNPRMSYYWYITQEECTSSFKLDTPVDDATPLPFVAENPPKASPDLPYFAREVPDSPPSPINPTANISCASAEDFLYVQILDLNNTVLENLQIASNQDATDSWQVASFPLDAYISQTIRPRFRATNDAQNYTFFLIDDVSLDIDPLPFNGEPKPEENRIYLPIVVKPALTDLFVQNNLGTTLHLTVDGVGSRSIPPSAPGNPYHWGTFPAGTYNWSATASGFAPASGTPTFSPGTVVWTWDASSSTSNSNGNLGETSQRMGMLKP